MQRADVRQLWPQMVGQKSIEMKMLPQMQRAASAGERNLLSTSAGMRRSSWSRL